jgi:hypothetical protein
MYGGLVMPTRSIAEPSDGSLATRARKRAGRLVPMSRPEEVGLVFVIESNVRWESAPRWIDWTEKAVNETIVRWLSVPRWSARNEKVVERRKES